MWCHLCAAAVWELVSPRRPFEGRHPGEIIHSVVTKNLRPAPWPPGTPQVGTRGEMGRGGGRGGGGREGGGKGDGGTQGREEGKGKWGQWGLKEERSVEIWKVCAEGMEGRWHDRRNEGEGEVSW
jgi:hypothetical protein